MRLLLITLLWGFSLPLFAIDLPPRIDIDYLMRSGLMEGLEGTVNETLEIKKQNGIPSYTITSEMRASGLTALVIAGSVVRDSKGTITTQGLRPDSFSDKRREKLNITIFDWKDKLLTIQRKGRKGIEHKDEQHILSAGAQDRLSALYYFLFSPLPKKAVDLYETDGRGPVKLIRYTIGEKETLDTPMGKLETIVLTKQQTEDDKLNRKIWLATAHYMLPVRIISTEKSGLVLEQIVTKINYTAP
ncbi:MAG: DUF3108 domain-containing protein [Nitrosomonadaceae bacterium]|nr:DUF3108 domain-containing protein [Nitrosomonadaceae bacterium]